MKSPDKILEKIHQASLKLLYPLTLEETCSIVGKEAMNLTKADYCTILLFQQGEFYRVYASNPLFYKSKPRGQGITIKVLKTHKPVIAKLVDLKNAPVHHVSKKLGIASTLTVPLVNRNRSWGVLSVSSKKRNNFSQKQVDILQLLASIVALAIRKTQLYDEMKSALESRDLFISMAAHEFRTPLTTINGYIQLLHSKLSGANTPESRWVEELSWEGSRLTQLVNELLEVNRVKFGQLNYHWKECAIKEVVSRAILDFRFTHPNRKVLVRDKISDNKDRVVGDFNKLLQAVMNLLDNAAKFSHPDSPIELTLRNKQSYVILDIKDKGKGISQAELQEVFEKFYRGSSHNREGMGIGLFLVKNIIKQHKGDIKIQSKEGKGTKVEIKIPQAKHG